MYDVIFIGAGCANLPAAYWLHLNKPQTNFLLVDIGTNVTRRDHESPIDSMVGVSGAGLMSDGKFSFYSSGTNVWKLDKKKLKSSYNFMKDFLSEFSEEI